MAQDGVMSKLEDAMGKGDCQRGKRAEVREAVRLRSNRTEARPPKDGPKNGKNVGN